MEQKIKLDRFIDEDGRITQLPRLFLFDVFIINRASARFFLPPRSALSISMGMSALIVELGLSL